MKKERKASSFLYHERVVSVDSALEKEERGGEEIRWYIVLH